MAPQQLTLSLDDLSDPVTPVKPASLATPAVPKPKLRPAEAAPTLSLDAISEPVAPPAPPPTAPAVPEIASAASVASPTIGEAAGAGRLPPAPNPFGGGNSTLPGGPGLKPGQTSVANDAVQPFGGTIQSALEGMQTGAVHAGKSIGQTGQALTGGTPTYEAPPPEATLPDDWSDPKKVAKWAGFQIGAAAPAIPVGAGAAYLASYFGGPAALAVGAGVGGVGFAGLSFAQTMGPMYAQHLAEGMPKQQAFDQAFEEAKRAGIVGGISGALFSFAPFKSALANIFLQSAVVQPAVSIGARIDENIKAGKDPIDGIGADYVSTALGTLVPISAFHGAGILLAGKQPVPRAKSTPEEIADFLARARAAQATDPKAADANAKAAQEAIFRELLKKEGWSQNDAEDLLNKVYGRGEPVTDAQFEDAPPPGYQPGLPPPEPPAAAAAGAPPPPPPSGGPPAAPAGPGVEVGGARQGTTPRVGLGATPPAEPSSPTPTIARPVQPLPVDSAATPTAPPSLDTLSEPVVGTGTRDDRVVVTHPDDIARASGVVNAEPSEAQKAAGNYQKGHVAIPGLEGYPVSIETPAGGARSGVGPDGAPWTSNMPPGTAYGYVRRTTGADGDHFDVFLGPNPNSGKAFIINQNTEAGKFDELKGVLGARTAAEARDLYVQSFTKGVGEKLFGGIREMTVPEFKAFLQQPGATAKPLNLPKPKAAPKGEPQLAADMVRLYRGVRQDNVDANATFFTDSRKAAETYAAMHGAAGTVIEREASFKNVLHAQDLGAAYKALGVPRPAREVNVSDDLIAAARHAGYDAIAYAGAVGREYVVLDPATIAKPAEAKQATSHRNETEAQNTENDGKIRGKFPESGTSTKNRQTLDDFIAEIEGYLAEGHFDAGLAPYGTLDDFRKAAAARGWTLGPYGKGKALWSADRKFVMFDGVSVEGNSPQVQWGKPREGIAAPPREESTRNDTGGLPPKGEAGVGAAPPVGGGAVRPGGADAGVGAKAGAAELGNALPAGIEAIRDRLLTHGFANILAARKFVEASGWKAPDPDAPLGKQIDEAIEFAVVLAARKIVADGKSPAETYKALVALYDAQPKLGVRTGKSMADQAYSTPAPLAYVASRLADVKGAKSVLEPTAGNGMLLIEANPRKVTANELDDARRATLTAQGFRAGGQDAATAKLRHAGYPVDTVIANPPFGRVREGGAVKTFTVDGWKTQNLDHAIALNSLSTMAEDGRAVLIVAGTAGRDQNSEALTRDGARTQGYNTQAQREFNVRLYRDYNVVDRFTVNGDLYARQGAQWPVDVIVIHGRGKSALALPGAELPPMFDTWEALKAKVNADGRSRQDAAEPARPGRAPAGNAPEGVPGSPRGNAGNRPPAGGRGSVGGDTSIGPEPGAIRGGGNHQQPADAGEPAKPAARVDAAGAGDGRRSGELPAAGERKPRLTNEAGQTTYQPKSRNADFNSLVPANQADAVRGALDRVAAAHGGNIDAFVARELGYNSNELGSYFSAEQVDALALAIHAHEHGSAIVLGDQTGVGKGRVVAAMARYAKRKGLVPVLFTEKPDLYGDMYRDLRDIGMPGARMVMTNTGTTVPMDEEAVDWKAEMDEAIANRTKRPARRGLFLRNPDIQQAYATLDRIAAGEDLADVVFTTYDQTNTVKGKDTARRAFLKKVARQAMFLLDESHNAGGQGQEGWKPAADKPVNRAEFLRELVGSAGGVIYSSATWAKRPQVMDLYRRTDMGKAVEKPEMLPALIERGGVPLQQIVSSMLANSGQYIRRERSFDGIAYTPVLTPVDGKTYGQFTSAVKAVYTFDRSISGKEGERAQLMKKALAAMGSAQMRDNAIGDAGAHSTEFSSIMHNLVNQMLLSIQAGSIAADAVKAWKAGEKPSIALSNTMETFLNDYADQHGVTVGMPLTIDFGDLLKRYLERSLRITIKDGEGKVSHHQFKPSDLSPEAQDRYRTAEAAIEAGDYAAMPVSPIDAMREAMEAAGMKVAEITGRHFILKHGKLANRPKAEMGAGGKRVTVRKYNNGQYDALIFNKSGSTGISMHAKADNDGRPRHMIIAQADPNIDTFMQTLGRTNRTGQIHLPRYTQSVPDVPAAVRPAAVLLKKMASLNANTTAARGSIFNAKSAVDFVNQYGDIVAERILADDWALNHELGGILRDEEEGGGGKPDDSADLIRKLTGRLVLLAPERQQEVIDRIQADYEALIKNLDALGENMLEAKTLELDAKTVDRTEIKPATGDNDFLAPVYLERINIKSPGRAMAPAEIVERVESLLAAGTRVRGLTDTPANKLHSLHFELEQVYRERLRNAGAAFAKWKHDNLAGIKNLNARERATKEADDNFARFTALTRMLTPGAIVHLASKNGEMPAVVLELRRPGKAKNPVALGSWAVSLAIPDSGREVQFNLSSLRQVGLGEKAPTPADGEVVVGPTMLLGPAVFDLFDAARKEGRENRLMVTGNILAGFDLAKGHGQIVNYKTDAGEIRPGIFVPRSTSHEDFMQLTAVRLAPAQVGVFLDRMPSGRVTSFDGVVAIYREGGRFTIDVAANREKGGRYFLEESVRKAVGDRFVKTKTREGQRMQAADLSAAQMQAAVAAMAKLGAVFETSEHQNVAREVVKANPAPRRQAMAVPSRGQIDTPAFKAWFGDSKVVDGAGKPLVVYHGSTKAFDTFASKRGVYYFAANPDVARAHGHGEGANVYPVFLSIKRPWIITAEDPVGTDLRIPGKEKIWVSSENLDASDARALESAGYDGVINYSSDIKEIIAFRPEQIKSAIGNDGGFDPNDARISAMAVPAEVARPFYSAVLRAVENSKTAKASPEQWLATIKNGPGIKQEEIDWIGLEDWLKGQSGPLAREAVADFVRANQIEVTEKVLGETNADDRQSRLTVEIDRWLREHGLPQESVDELLHANAVLSDYERLGQEDFEAEYGVHTQVPMFQGRERLTEEEKAYLEDFSQRWDATHATRREDDNETHFGGGSLVLAGGKDYHELLLTLPEKLPPKPDYKAERIGSTTKFGYEIDEWSVTDRATGAARNLYAANEAEAIRRAEASHLYPDPGNFTAGHFNEPNVLVHVRFNTRYVPPEGAPAYPEQLDEQIRERRKMLENLTKTAKMYRGREADRRKDMESGRFVTGTYTLEQYGEMAGSNEAAAENVKAEIAGMEDMRGRYGKTLFLEEIQSDWHKQGRKKGYGNPAQAELDALMAKLRAAHGDKWAAEGPANDVARVGELQRQARNPGVPDAPFKTTWSELAFKRMVRWAAEHGYDQIAWTPGIEQVKRYETELRERVQAIEWVAGSLIFREVEITPVRGAQTYFVSVDANGVVEKFSPDSMAHQLGGKPIEELVGKEVARRILEEKEGRIEGDNLVIGGKGYTDLYDKALVKFADKLGKKFGSKVGQTTIYPGLERAQESYDNGDLDYDKLAAAKGGVAVHSLPITDAMRASVMQGQALFARRPVDKGNMVFPGQPDGTLIAYAPTYGEDLRVVSAGTGSEAERLVNEVQSIVSRLIGNRVPVVFYDRIVLTNAEHGDEMAAAASAAGTGLLDTVGGFYEHVPGLPLQSLISIAVGDSGYAPLVTARHEPAHDIYTYLLNEAEHAIVDADFGRGAKSTMRRNAAEAFQRTPDDPFVMQIPKEELFAFGFQVFDEKAGRGEANPGAGLHMAIRRIYEKLRRMFQALRRWLTRQNINTMEDLYRAMHEGEMVSRRHSLEAVAESLGQTSPFEAKRSAMAGVRTPPRPPEPPKRQVTDFVRNQEDEIFKLATRAQADVSQMAAFMGRMKKAIGPGVIRGIDSRFYYHAEDLKGGHLTTPEQEELWKEYGQPLKDIEQADYARASTLAREQSLSDDELAELQEEMDPEYQHRMVKGKTPQFDIFEGSDQSGNPIYSGRGLPHSTSSMKTPVYFAIEADDGERMVVSASSEGIHRWQNDQPQAAFRGSRGASLEIGKRYRILGRMWTVKRARTPEIEAATPTRYYKSFFATTVDNILRLRRVIRSLEYVRDLKATPEWAALSAGISAKHPRDWTQVDAPGLRGYWIHPRLANPINDYLQGGARVWKGKLAEKAEAVNRLAVGAMFWSPIPHIENVALHWVVARGWDWITPRGIHSLVADTMWALQATVTENADYRQYLRAGASLPSSRVTNRRFIEQMLRLVGHRVIKQRNRFQQVADMFGYGPVENMVKEFYRHVSQVLWMGNDVFMLQRIRELERKGYTRAAAIQEAGNHIPDYRLPSEVMGSRAYSELLQDPNLFVFNRYHYGIFKSYARMLADATATSRREHAGDPRGKGKKAFDAVGQLLTLGFIAIFLGPYLNAATQALFGNDKRTHLIARGPFSVPTDIYELIHGDINTVQFIMSFLSPTPLFGETLEQVFGYDLYVSQFGIGSGHIVRNKANWAQEAQDRLKHIFTSMPLGGQVDRGSKKGVGNVLLQQLGVSTP